MKSCGGWYAALLLRDEVLEGRTLPELTVASCLAVVASAGFVVDVVPVMSCADILAVLAFY